LKKGAAPKTTDDHVGCKKDEKTKTSGPERIGMTSLEEKKSCRNEEILLKVGTRGHGPTPVSLGRTKGKKWEKM